MVLTESIKKRLSILKTEYNTLSNSKDKLIKLINEAELAESVYNSNAIENSTLTLKETETILLDKEVPVNVSVREVYEAKNLARVMEFIRSNGKNSLLNSETILTIHEMLIVGIDDNIAGRFRKKNEYVRVGAHIAPAPEHVERMIEDILNEYENNIEDHPIEKISKYHLDFEAIHPFNDGNGRMGRVIINCQLNRIGFPNIILRDKEKATYYRAFREYNDLKTIKTMVKILTLALFESLHKRITYFKDQQIISLSEHAKREEKSLNSLINKARRQTIPAFRERGVWKIGIK